jgi:hypothetical protein
MCTSIFATVHVTPITINYALELAGHNLAIWNFAEGPGAGDLTLKNSAIRAFANWECHIVRAHEYKCVLVPTIGLWH